MTKEKVENLISNNVIKKLVHNDLNNLYPKIYKTVSRYLDNEVHQKFFEFILSSYNEEIYDEKFNNNQLKFHFLNNDEEKKISIIPLQNTSSISVNIIDAIMKTLEFINISLKRIDYPKDSISNNQVVILFEINGDEIDKYLALSRLKNYIKFIKNKNSDNK